MDFYHVVNNAVPKARGGDYVVGLHDDRWDDWRQFRTQFHMVVYAPDGQSFPVGDVKIGQIGLRGASAVAPGQRAPAIDPHFEQLDARFFSLGQGDTYYEALQALPNDLGSRILLALRDCAYDLDIYAAHRDEDVMQVSLLRYVSHANVIGRLHRIANGDLAPTPFHFEYAFRSGRPDIPAPVLEFQVTPDQQPPTNVHVLIGRNGAGKTRFLQSMARSILAPEGPDEVGRLVLHTDALEDWAFASLVYVSFSAFDDFELPPASQSTLKAAQVSLTGEGAVSDRSGQTTRHGARLFSKSFEACRVGLRRARWLEAISILESDPLFEEYQVKGLADLDDLSWRQASEDFFGHLSSGHAVVLLTITRLVELVDERTLVLMDEPEGHLHPPLLSALVRSLSNLLTRRNGVAIIATHSPVVLQEVPRSCVWMLRRSGWVAVAERPQFETFGENVGSLTREVFGLEVTASGFHTLIDKAVTGSGGSYEAVLAHFDDQLGTEARAIARGLVFARPPALS
jgi:predicted ATPase